MLQFVYINPNSSFKKEASLEHEVTTIHSNFYATTISRFQLRDAAIEIHSCRFSIISRFEHFLILTKQRAFDSDMKQELKTHFESRLQFSILSHSKFLKRCWRNAFFRAPSQKAGHSVTKISFKHGDINKYTSSSYPSVLLRNNLQILRNCGKGGGGKQETLKSQMMNSTIRSN